MATFYQICEIGLVLALAAFVLVLIYLAVTAISIKNTAMRCAKRLYERPLNSTKAIGKTGKGIIAQEKVRVQYIAGSAKAMANDVKEAAFEVKEAAQSIHPEEIKSAVGNVKTTLQFVAAIKRFTQAMASQRATRA